MLRNHLSRFRTAETPPPLRFEAKNILIIPYVDKDKALEGAEKYVKGKLLPFEINKSKSESEGDSPLGYFADMNDFNVKTVKHGDELMA